MFKRVEDQTIPMFETREERHEAFSKMQRIRDIQRLRERSAHFSRLAAERLADERLERKMARMPKLIAGLQ